MTNREADRRATLFVAHYPPKKIAALDKRTLMRDAYARGLLAAGRVKPLKRAVRLDLSPRHVQA